MTEREPASTEQASDRQRGLGDWTGAIVIGSDYAGLGIVRSLGRRGIPVWVICDGGHATAAVSRYARRRMDWPAADEASRLDYLVKLCIRHGLDGWALYPTSDEAAALLARHEAVLSKHFLLTTPSWEAMRWAYDKRLTYDLSAKLGIDHPWTCYPRSREEAESLDCTFPAILKPAVKERDNRFTQARAWRVEDRRQLLERYDEASELVDPANIMVQELIPGGGENQFSFAALCARGCPLAWAVARRTRQYPLDFGHGSTFVETIDLPAIEEPSRRLLSALSYGGLVELEFKRDPRTGQAKLLDINARAWGWHTLGRRAGTDFPYLSWQLIHGGEVSETSARRGVRWVRGTTDVAAALAEIRRGRLSPGAYLHSLRPPLECAVLALDDLLPSVLDVPSLLLRMWRRTSPSDPLKEIGATS